MSISRRATSLASVALARGSKTFAGRTPATVDLQARRGAADASAAASAGRRRAYQLDVVAAFLQPGEPMPLSATVAV
jgi:hypothetical protein